ncbi:MAG: LOG family protein [Spirochaetota bacterium]
MSRPTPPLAFENNDFLTSREARTIRILSEYIDPEARFKKAGVQNTVVFFGSARIRPDKDNPMSKYYWAAEDFAHSLACYSKELKPAGNDFYICTGGGPGIMEAANRGADRAGEKTIGLNISLPFEQHPNEYITEELNFSFHYFYMRKLWFLYQAKALIVFPGGFGTMDELFETLTLIQTEKVEKGHIPVLLYDKAWWQRLFNFQQLVDDGLIAKEDLSLLSFFNSTEEGMSILKPKIEELIVKVQKTM